MLVLVFHWLKKWNTYTYAHTHKQLQPQAHVTRHHSLTKIRIKWNERMEKEWEMAGFAKITCEREHTHMFEHANAGRQIRPLCVLAGGDGRGGDFIIYFFAFVRCVVRNKVGMLIRLTWMAQWRRHIDGGDSDRLVELVFQLHICISPFRSAADRTCVEITCFRNLNTCDTCLSMEADSKSFDYLRQWEGNVHVWFFPRLLLSFSRWVNDNPRTIYMLFSFLSPRNRWHFSTMRHFNAAAIHFNYV